ncbi:DUF397 domain-containing protein [Streptomyces beijiangensis]|uniref:DUF397 domain-containing protein n=1 Tax=Streptomyces beijiangensis TaxID=163361 RepID=A0A939FA87_9ACTN|nr:DUF397 domain-containing protein [Streptomyces beijiangensis]MBO0514586.1 DUF397 domain-containing protein [Streptomyces beijiangensis]
MSVHTPQWFKSSYSNGAGGECVECAHLDGSTLVRDSKRAHGAQLGLAPAVWSRFVEALRDEQLS